jgi:hypothetical protein
VSVKDERERPFPASICHRCAHHRYVLTKTSTFIRCAIPEIKYCSQPVRACELFEAEEVDRGPDHGSSLE